MPNNKPDKPKNCEDIGFQHCWEYPRVNIMFPRDPSRYPPKKRRCLNCGRIEEQVLVQPEIREWRIIDEAK